MSESAQRPEGGNEKMGIGKTGPELPGSQTETNGGISGWWVCCRKWPWEVWSPCPEGQNVNNGVYTLTPFCLRGKMLRSSYSIHKQGLYRPQGSLGYRVVIAHPEAIPSTFFLLHIPFCSFPEAWKSRHPLLQALLYLKLENATIYGWWDRKKPFKSSWALLFSLTERKRHVTEVPSFSFAFVRCCMKTRQLELWQPSCGHEENTKSLTERLIHQINHGTVRFKPLI